MITDLNRKSIFESHPDLKKTAEDQISIDGSDFSFVKSSCFWQIIPDIEWEQIFIFKFKINFLKVIYLSESNPSSSFQTLDEIEIYLDHKSAKILLAVLK